MTYREVSENIFSFIREIGFKPVNIKYEDGYFLFDMGEDSVVHFDIKGLRNWKFAMWIMESEKNKNNFNIRFFCRHKLDLDKFKPSRSFFLEEMELSQDELESSDIHDTLKYSCDIDRMLKTIKKHPFVSFYMDWNSSYYSDESYILYYFKCKVNNIKRKTKEWVKDMFPKIIFGFKAWFIKKYKVVDYVVLKDMNTEDFKISPRYNFHIHFKKISENEDIQNEYECKVLDRWIPKTHYNNVYYYCTRDDIKGRYTYRFK